MCGIAGYLGLPGEVHETSLRQVLPCLQERGPDASNVWVNAEASTGLAHTRLAIIDPDARSNQPFNYLDRYQIVFNGEIYNYQSLRKDLERLHGLSFTTASDTEVLVASYHIHKENCLSYLVGMFAFAIWDEKEQVLFCARDRFGEKPFYYYRDQQKFLFGSKAAAIHALGIKRIVNQKILLHYLAAGQTNIAADPFCTFFENIHQLPPAHFLIIDKKTGKTEVRRYWDLPGGKTVFKINAKDELYDLLLGSVKERLKSDVPLGVSISGGLDSSSIAYILSSELKTDLAGFSAVFPGFDKDESSYIDELEKSLNLNRYRITPTSNDFQHHLLRMIHSHDHPIADPSSFAQYMVYRMAKQHGYSVMLDGQGADEILAGYSKYNHWAIQELVRNNKIGKALELYRSLQANQQEIKGGLINFLFANMPGITKKQVTLKYRNQVRNAEWLNEDFVESNFSLKDVQKPLVRSLNDILYFDTMQLGLQELLRYADCNSMAHGVEIRLPFLDHRLVEFIFSLPLEEKIHDGFNKYVLRKAMDKKIPDKITWRKRKIGFEVPKDQWMETLFMKDMVEDSCRKLITAGVIKNKELPLLDKAARWRIAVAGQLLEKSY